MEISRAVLRRAPISSGVWLRRDAAEESSSAGRRDRISAQPRGVSSGRFSEEGHLQYYLPPVRCGGRKKEEKKRAKLVKGLSKDLSAFYSMGFGIESEGAMVGEVKGKMMTEAAELLLTQLKQLRAEEKELKRKRKQEKAATKAARMKDCADSSSCSSSESSDSDCEAVVRMSTIRTADLTEPKPDILAAPTEALVCKQALQPLELKAEEKGIEENRIELKLGHECSSSSATVGICKSNGVLVGKPMDKIEVCMGGKCKKSGALELLAEFERKVGVEGSVVGCKCMGKCRDGPNVRVLNHCNEEDSVKNQRNPLCIGVGLEDVGAIVSNFFGEKKDVGLVAA